MQETRALISAYLAKVAIHQADALLSLVYWTVLAVTVIVLKVLGRHLLPDTFGRPGSHWLERRPAAREIPSLMRQF